MRMDLWKLWGKTRKDAERQVIGTHPLIGHMVDVAEVIGVLWERCLGLHWHQHACSALGCDSETARQTIMFWAALHDLGKASPSFQRRYQPARSLLEDEGLSFVQHYSKDTAYHGLISAWALEPLLQQRFGLSRPLARDLAKALGGHHGSWPTPGATGRLTSDDTGDAAWDAVRGEIYTVLHTLYSPPAIHKPTADRMERQALVTLLGGLVSVADWIGSMEEYFGGVDAQSPGAYALQAQAIARRAVGDLQWDAWQPPQEPAPFNQLFPFSPRPEQQAIIDLAPALDGPSLVLVEAPTGCGKTEAALYLADQWAHRLGQRGLYVAMPTMATSNAMYGRVVQMLDRRYGAGQVSPLLIHSQSRWTNPSPRVHTESERDDNLLTDAENMGWFLPRKRSLLAPFGVGTVDQTLLSVLLTRHFFVRLFGLAHKTIIFDEVHAYDTYMSTLFARLLKWLRADGCSVVMLSATLPDSTRRAFMAAYGAGQSTAPGQAQAAPLTPYPSVTWVSGAKSGCMPLPVVEAREIELRWHPRDDDALAATLRQALAEGGCAAVLCNTVRRAQDVYLALQEAAIVPQQDLTLFHARYPHAWREEIEQKVLSRYDQNSTPGTRRGIVVATQVIEQSLDLDFDLMVSDLAPIDLILQRAGRLHRHAQRERPPRLSNPRMLLIEPESAESLPEWGSDAYVYEPYVLLRTWLALQERTRLALPSETQMLIEAVYGDEEGTASGPLAKALAKAREAWEKHRREHSQIAAKKLVLPPDDEDLMIQANPDYAEDAPQVHESMQALTRLGEPSITLVCLHETPRGLALESEGRRVVDLYQKPWAELTRELVEHSVSVSDRALVRLLAQQEAPVGWREHPLLRYDRLAVFSRGVCQLEGTGYTLRLSRDLGLQIEMEDQ